MTRHDVRAREGHACPICGLPLTYVENDALGIYAAGAAIIIPLASELWECPLHRRLA